MPENIVNPRRPLHENRISKTPQPQLDESDEDELFLDDSQEPMTTKSGSDLEDEFEDVTYSTYKKQERLEKSRSVPRTPQRPKRNHTINPIILKKTTPDSNNTYQLYIFSAIMAAVAIYLCYNSWFTNEPEIKFCNFTSLQEKYQTQNPNLWNKLKIGIELILNKRTQKPAVYLFGHRGSHSGFNLIKDIAIRSSKCFGENMTPIEMESDDFILAPGVENDYGYAIEKYKSKIVKGNVILIANLNEIPAEAARALHYICDTHSPISKTAVIFLTLTIQTNKEGKPDAVAEETLHELWGTKLDRTELDPLITRLTDQVIILQS